MWLSVHQGDLLLLVLGSVRIMRVLPAINSMVTTTMYIANVVLLKAHLTNTCMTGLVMGLPNLSTQLASL
jgi:hypothetical protein